MTGKALSRNASKELFLFAVRNFKSLPAIMGLVGDAPGSLPAGSQ
jgi:hypothetical protein